MSKIYAIAALVIVYITVLVFIWMIKDRVCEVDINQGDTNFAARLACDLER